MRHFRQAQLQMIREDILKGRVAAEQEFLKSRIMYLSQYYTEFHDQQQNQPADRLLRVKGAKNLELNKVGEPHVRSSEIASNILQEKALQIQQQMSLIRNIAGFVEKELHLDDTKSGKLSQNRIIEDPVNELTKDEKQKERLEALKHKWHLYSNFSLNMDYQATKLLSVSEKEQQNELSQQCLQFEHKLFECDNEDLSSKIECVSLSSNSISLSSWLYSFENKSKPIDELNLSVSSLSNEQDYYKFDDSLATLFIAKPDCHFKKIYIEFDCGAQALLIVLRFLLLVKSCNIIQIQPLSSIEGGLVEKKDLLEQIFYLIFSMKNLQEIEIRNTGLILPELTAGLVRTDPTTSNISSVIMQDNHGYCLDMNRLADFFERMSQLPKLINFECSSLELSGYRLQTNFSRFVEKLQFAHMNLIIARHYSPHFPLSNLITFQGTIVFQQKEFIVERLNSFLSSFKDATQIQTFSLVTSVEHNSFYKSRKEILNEARKQKELQKEREIAAKLEKEEKIKQQQQGETLQKDEQKQIDEKKESDQVQEESQAVEETTEKEVAKTKVEENEEEKQIEEQGDEVEIDFKDFPEENCKWFQHLKNASNLTTFNVRISSINKEIFDGLVGFLSNTTKIWTFHFECLQLESHSKSTNDEDYDDRTNFKSLYEILNDLVYIRQFSLKVDTFEIKYNLPSQKATLYDLTLKAPLVFQQQFAVSSFLEFSLEKVQSIQVNIGQIAVLKILDNLLKSVSNSKMMKQLEINISEFTGLKKFIEKCPINKSELLFFKHFDSLKQLEHLKLKVPFNQHVLDSISGFLRESQELKSFIFKRTQPEYKQFYLNYTLFLAAIFESKTLQQLYLSTGIERIPSPRKYEHRLSWNSDKIAHFYSPLSLLLRNAPESLRTIEIDEGNANQEGLKLVIESLIQARVLLYTKLDYATVSAIQNCQDNTLIELYNESITLGIIVKPSYRFPLTQDTSFTLNPAHSYILGEQSANLFHNEDYFEKYFYDYQKFVKDQQKANEKKEIDL